MPRQVNPVSVLRPATEIVTSIRVRALRAKKHITKLNDEELDFHIKMVLLSAEKLEKIIKQRLKQEVAKCTKG
jgi:hypothetical protein